MAALVVACGSGSTDASGSSTTSSTEGGSTTETTEQTESTPPTEPTPEGDYQPTEPMLDIVDPKNQPIDDVAVGADGSSLLVRYHNSTEPCSGAIASATEDDTSITVSLVAGLNPGAASMSCINEVVAYELQVTLDDPVGDRQILLTTVDGSTVELPTTGGSGTTTTSAPATTTTAAGGESSLEAFIGLSLADASALAESEDRPWRISRQDDEVFILTADAIANRVTFEVDAGVVTDAIGG